MDSMFSSMADNFTRRAAEARAMNWLQERGLRWEDSIPAEQMPAILIEFSNFMNAEMKRLCNHYQKVANDAMGLKMPEPFLIVESPCKHCGRPKAEHKSGFYGRKYCADEETEFEPAPPTE
jgi:hypothetical protein